MAEGRYIAPGAMVNRPSYPQRRIRTQPGRALPYMGVASTLPIRQSGCREANRVSIKKHPRELAGRRMHSEAQREIGVRLRYLREVLGHSQAAWARELQLTPSLLNKWEQGTRPPNHQALIIIAKSTRCTMDYLFMGEIGPMMDPRLRRALLSAHPHSPFLSEVSASVEEPPEPPPSAGASAIKRKPRA